MDSVIDAGSENYVMICGDLSNDVVADRLGMTLEFIPQIFGSSGRPTGQRGWMASYRCGADLVNDRGAKLLDVTGDPMTGSR